MSDTKYISQDCSRLWITTFDTKQPRQVYQVIGRGQKELCSQSEHFQITMYLLAASLCLLASASASPLKVTSPKAASPYVNIGCQCSPLTFLDQYGTVQVSVYR